jgi:DNA replication protein DnaC
MQQALQLPQVQDLSVGSVPSKGFGIGSDTGSGKTMAIAAIIRGFLRQYRSAWADQLAERTRASEIDEITFDPQVHWLDWPDTVTTIRTHAIDGKAEQILEIAETAPLLVLDDLGRERVRGSYVDDFAASQLDRIVSRRYRAELPILWTTNLSEIDLTSIYGAALVSRLIEDAPLYWIDGLPSMRMAG